MRCNATLTTATETDECRKRGPYLPLGLVEWECTTHNVELVRIAGEWGTNARRDDMVCPVAQPLPAEDDQ